MDQEFDEQTFGAIKNLMIARLGEIIDMYLTNSRKYLDQIQSGIEKYDAQIIKDAAHPLKSSSATMGMMRLSSQAKEMEYQAKDGRVNSDHDEALKTLFSELEAAYMSAEKYLNAQRPPS